jgi:hypothetical protein
MRVKTQYQYAKVGKWCTAEAVSNPLPATASRPPATSPPALPGASGPPRRRSGARRRRGLELRSHHRIHETTAAAPHGCEKIDVATHASESGRGGRPDASFEPSKVDLVSISPNGSTVNLCIVAEQPLTGSDVQLRSLQEKIHNYVGYVLDGQMSRELPETSGLAWRIRHRFSRRPAGRSDIPAGFDDRGGGASVRRRPRGSRVGSGTVGGAAWGHQMSTRELPSRTQSGL